MWKVSNTGTISWVFYLIYRWEEGSDPSKDGHHKVKTDVETGFRYGRHTESSLQDLLRVKHVGKSWIISCLHLEEHQEIFEHDFEGEEKVEQEGGAYWDQGMQNIEDDVADEVVEGDERREDVEGCSRDAVKSNFRRHWNVRINVPYCFM